MEWVVGVRYLWWIFINLCGMIAYNKGENGIDERTFIVFLYHFAIFDLKRFTSERFVKGIFELF